MSSILDIDLDYFSIIDNPIEHLHDLLKWARRPVDFIVEKHHMVLKRWKGSVRKGVISPPTHILHVDEHHDMMDERKSPNIANFMYLVMSYWPGCRVYWLVEQPIDSPEMWISENVWNSLAPRFSQGSRRPHNWPRPDLVSVCTSPEFIDTALRSRLISEIEEVNRMCHSSN